MKKKTTLLVHLAPIQPTLIKLQVLSMLTVENGQIKSRYPDLI